MKLLPIFPSLEQNPTFRTHPDCQGSLPMTIAFYEQVGFQQPWICYYAEKNSELVGNAAYKGAPQNGQVEIAYATFQRFQKQGIGTQICEALVKLALETDPEIEIIAQTLPEKNFSTRILEKNGFLFQETLRHPEDGTIWQWIFAG